MGISNPAPAAVPIGPAGGDLGGSYPNPDVVATHLSAPLPLAQGGTGAGDAPGARTALGLGTMAIQNAATVDIEGGTIDGTLVGATTPAAIIGTTITGNAFVPNSASTPANGLYQPASNELGFSTNGTSAARFNSSQQFLLGGTAVSAVPGFPSGAKMEVAGVDGSSSTWFQTRWQNNANGTTFVQAKSRGASIGTHTAVQNGDPLGQWNAYGSDGTDFALGGVAQFSVDETPGNDAMPTRFSVLTSPDGSQIATERLRADSSGNIVLGNSQGGTLATTATKGWPMVPSSAGAPTGTPAKTYTGFVPMQVDTTNNRVYFNYGGTWHYASLT